MNKKVVVFDFMDTLVPDPFHQAVSKLAGNMKQFIALKNPEIYLQFEHGAISEETYLNGWFKDKAAEKKAGFTAQMFKDEILKTPPMFSHAEEVVKKLFREHDLYIASNYSSWIHHHLDALNIDYLFKEIFVSYQMGVRKPDNRFFEILEEKINRPAIDIVFVDDREENVQGANKAGMISVLARGDWVQKLLTLL